MLVGRYLCAWHLAWHFTFAEYPLLLKSDVEKVFNVACFCLEKVVAQGNVMQLMNTCQLFAGGKVWEMF